MPEVLTTSAKISCPHGGRAVLSSSKHDLFVDGKQVLIETDVHEIAPGSCGLSSSSPPHPCVKIKWSGGSQYSKNEGIGVLTKRSIGKCYNINMVFQGQAIIFSTQREVLSNG